REGAMEGNASQRTSHPPGAAARSGLQQRPGDEVYLFDDVGRQTLDGAARLLRRDGPGGQENERRRAQGFQESDRKREAGSGSENTARGRRELSGTGGSESLPAAVVGHPLAAAVRARPRREDHGGQAGRRID